MGIRERLSGNEAVATAMKQINPDVVAAFPITPSTEIPQYFSTFVSNGQVDTNFVAVESEHSAMSACIGSEAAGARTMTATSANGIYRIKPTFTNSNVTCKQSSIRAIKHTQRPFRCNGS